VCFSCLLFDCPPSLSVDCFGSPFFLSFSFSFFSFFLGFVYYCKLANIKLHIDQGQKHYQVEWWEDERDGSYSPPKNKLVQDTEGNEENRYSDSDSNKTKINYTKEPNKAHKNTLKEEILRVINENFREMLLDMVNKNVQEALKKFQDNKNIRIWENTKTNKWTHRSPK
jgi:hypothetical protein